MSVSKPQVNHKGSNPVAARPHQLGWRLGRAYAESPPAVNAHALITLAVPDPAARDLRWHLACRDLLGKTGLMTSVPRLRHAEAGHPEIARPAKEVSFPKARRRPTGGVGY